MGTTNEPVAWIDPYDLEGLPYRDCWVNGQQHKNSVPLYTHPAKTLTDEEILELAQLMFFDTRYPNIALNFARAILKKASEK